MLRLDDRAGSRELYSPLLATGVKVEMTRLPYGDVEFDGYGPDDIPVSIGIEHKQVSDVLKCILDGRFSGHQLPGLMARYSFVYLVVEGCTRAGPNGIMQVENGRGQWFDAQSGSRQLQHVDFDMWLTGIELCAGVHIRRTRNQSDSSWFIVAIYRWFQKRWQDHRAHTGFDRSDKPSLATLVHPNITRRMAKEIAGIGWERSGAIADKFANPVDMVAATEDEWVGIDGIGRTMARKIMRELGSDKLWEPKP